MTIYPSDFGVQKIVQSHCASYSYSKYDTKSVERSDLQSTGINRFISESKTENVESEPENGTEEEADHEEAVSDSESDQVDDDLFGVKIGTRRGSRKIRSRETPSL